MDFQQQNNLLVNIHILSWAWIQFLPVMKCICSLIFLQNFNFIDIKCKSVLDILKWSSLVTVFTVVTCNYHLTPDTEDVAWLVSAVYWHSLEATHCPRLGRSDSGCEETPLPAQLATLHCTETWDMTQYCHRNVITQPGHWPLRSMVNYAANCFLEQML